jgi:8-oxo-dGTP diphosphatase
MPDRPELCVGAVALHDGNLLLIRRGHGPAAGEWSLPGGRLERGELLAEAVTRELREETGLEAVCGPLVGWVERMSEPGDPDAADAPGGPASYHFVILDFEVTVLDDAEPTAGDDAAEARWVPLPDVTDLRLVEGLAEFLHEHGILEVIT